MRLHVIDERPACPEIARRFAVPQELAGSLLACA